LPASQFLGAFGDNVILMIILEPILTRRIKGEFPEKNPAPAT